MQKLTDREYQIRIDWDPVPEPSTVILLTMGAVGLLACGWRRRRVA